MPPSAGRVSREQALAFRLAGHHLAERRPPEALLEVTAACGVRNTPPGSAPLALQARLADLAPDAAERALGAERSLVEVLAMRLSPHLVPAQDVAVFTLGARPADEASLRVPLASHLPTLARAGMSTVGALDRAAEAAAEALADGPLTRGELSARMTGRLPEALSVWCRPCNARHVQESLFRLVGVRGVFVIARQGTRDLYARADHWLGGWPAGDPAVARAELLRRYLRCFGPSTASHFAGWAGIGAEDARRSWDALADELMPVELDGRRAWLLAADAARLDAPPPAVGVRLLPPYDAYLDQRDRETLVPEKALHRRIWRVLGNPGVVLADGRIVGLWRPRKTGRRLLVTVEPLAELPERVRTEIAAEAAGLAPHRGCATAEVAFAVAA